MGPYCKFCDRRCFVERVLPNGRWLYLATCLAGMLQDEATYGVDQRTAGNPYAVAGGAP